MIVQTALNAARDRMVAAGLDGADRDARWLVAAALGVEPGRVILHLRDRMSDAQVARLTRAVADRLDRKPVSQILGGRRFHGRWFTVTGDALDPRPETETLVDLALRFPFQRVLDLGTGSGCILLSLLADRPEATGLGVDLSTAALAVARCNARALGLDDRAQLDSSNWLSGVEGRFDLIVANPPYVSEAEYAELAPEVRRWEPRMALTPGGDGLDAYRVILRDAPDHLRPGGRLLVEIGASQGRAVAGLFSSAGLDAVAIHPDLNGKDRVVVGRCQSATTR